VRIGGGRPLGEEGQFSAVNRQTYVYRLHCDHTASTVLVPAPSLRSVTLEPWSIIE